jgi:ABC-2 type transport system permease protein
MGDPAALFLVVVCSFLLFLLVVARYSRTFGDHVLAAAGAAYRSVAQPEKRAFRQLSTARALRSKEWTLLKRDPWLVSQTLMQILYLLPPAFLLWRQYGEDAGALVVLVPVLVTAVGQLAGGLAWLAVSGEDAPDLVATAPVASGALTRAKIEAVLGAIGIVVAPLLLALALADLWMATVALLGLTAAAASAITIQLLFRVQARRSHFRRRQVSSRAATFAEAFSSLTWAGTAGLMAAGSWFAVLFGIFALGVVLCAWLISPHKIAP